MKSLDTRNQKVFVPLASVLDVQAEYVRLRNQVKEMRGKAVAGEKSRSEASVEQYTRGMAKVILELGLPIDIQR